MSSGWVFWTCVALSAVCVVHLWARATGGVGKKLLWSGIMMFPVMGPLFYGAMYEAPADQDEDLQAKETDTDSESS